MMFFVLYLDNLLYFALDKACLTQIEVQQSVSFKMTDLGKISDYVEIEVDVEIGI